jgi:FAD/FMN-containing dehydrogenase
VASVDPSAIEKLKTGLQGTACTPGEEGYDEGRKAFNPNAHQEPALVVVAGAAADIVAAVELAREQGLGVGVLATGHGVANPCDGGVLVNTSGMRGVSVDVESQTARVEPGTLWSDVIPEAQAHGLMGLAGSSSGVGVVGYTLGGGYGWLGRKYGFAAESMRGADVVTADGEPLKASPDENADLFWGLKGSGGNFGIVTSLEFALYPLDTVFARRDDHIRYVLELPARAGAARGAARPIRRNGAGLLLWGPAGDRRRVNAALARTRRAPHG